ncbi:NAD-dependent epimerase/dehydratase [Arabidopsis thaliana x Arabidopsis arenosa]|uniref:NAD-dependent epimerase/dehydratase n=1 Tax=Arabidopsis thaliana x Arabidopsis arenosa TaxID=1240361 RepID=A0A8T2CCB6_9BRAS|nr:NAD-dependent epimerase/dehydratase [Arabidopsis thaliana x Arabidopsis arenosa]
MAEYLVTGGTGFIASHVIKSLLEFGHYVRTTVRDSGDEEKVGFLWELKGAKERLKIFEADLMVEGSFDDAVNGVDGVFHIASRVSVGRDNNNLEKFDPNISGTMNVMNSCAKSRNTVKRIVLTSSSTTIRYRFDATQVSPLNESHWTDPEYCKRFKIWYGYKKTIGEKEAWRIATDKKLNLVVVIPSFCIGPILSPKPTSSPRIFLSIIKGTRGAYPNFRGGFVHIDDVVAAQILAMEEPKASGRILCSSSVAHWSEIIEMLRIKYPLYPFETKCGSEEGRDMPHSLDTTKIHEHGFTSFKSLPEMFDDCIKSFQDKGLL